MIVPQTEPQVQVVLGAPARPARLGDSDGGAAAAAAVAVAVGSLAAQV